MDKPVRSKQGHFQLVSGRGGRKNKSRKQGDDALIWLDTADTLWAVAGIHFVTNHQRKNVIERAAPIFMLSINSRAIRCLLDYCVDCSLCQLSESYSTMDADTILTSALNEKGGPTSRKKVLQLLKDHGSRSGAAPQQTALCSRLYLGQLWSYLSRKWSRRTDIVFVGFLKITDEKGVLFSLDNDSGVILRTDAIEFKLKSKRTADTPCFVPREALRLPLLHHLKSTCQYDTKLININIYHFDLFDAVPCDVYHWVGDWHNSSDVPKTGTRDDMKDRTALPIVLASAIHRLLVCITDRVEIQRRSLLWKTVAKNSGADWLTTVLCFYDETQWEIHRPRNSSFILKHNGPKKELDAIGASNFQESEIVDASNLVQRHLSEAILVDEHYKTGFEHIMEDREVYPLRKSGAWNNGLRENLNWFNFELLSEHVPGGYVVQGRETPPVRIQTLKVLLYIYVFRDALKRNGSIPDSVEEAEELFAQYWDEFSRRAPDHIQSFLTEETDGYNARTDDSDGKAAAEDSIEEADEYDDDLQMNTLNGSDSENDLDSEIEELDSDGEPVNLNLKVKTPRKNVRTASSSVSQNRYDGAISAPSENDIQKEQQSKKRRKNYPQFHSAKKNRRQ